MSRRVHPGQVAAGGMASGTLRLDRRSQRSIARPATTVIAAIAATLQQLRELQAGSGKLGREILQFQVELLEDDLFVLELLERAAMLNSGEKAVEALLGEQIERFLAAETETFAARAADVLDLRERLLASFSGGEVREDDALPEGTILLVDDITPSRFLEMDWSKISGVAAQAGSTASHVALLARSQRLPMLVGLGAVDASVLERPALLDAVSGSLIVDPEPAELRRVALEPAGITIPDEEGDGAATLPDGTRVRINVSVNSLADLDQAQPHWFDAIGLARTELLVSDPEDLLSETAQAAIYRRLFEWASGRPVTIRLFDGGGDKPIPGFSPIGESNAFLGIRGARILARRTDVLRTQYGAILRAAAGRRTRILVPMLTLPREMALFRECLHGAIEQVGADPAGVELGMMVETPAAVLEIGNFDADFFAIGTNDLVQYTLAASRDAQAFDVGDELAPSVLELIARVVDEGRRRGADVTLCGEAATSRVQLKQVLACGITSLAIPPRFAPAIKHLIRTDG